MSNAFMYADDIVLLSPTISALKFLVIICEIYAEDYFLTFNIDKCYLLIFLIDGCDIDVNRIKIEINNKTIKIVRQEMHLGNCLASNRHIIQLKQTINDMKARTTTIINNFHHISFMGKIKLFNSQCLSLYGAQLWDLKDPDVEQLIVTWRKCVRSLLGLPFSTRSYILPYIMNSFNILDTIMERQSNFYVQMFNHTNVNIKNCIKNAMLYQTSYCISNINSCINRFNIVYVDFFNVKKNMLKRKISNTYNDIDWRANLVLEILHCLDGQLDSGLTKEELKSILNDVAVAR